MSGVTQLVEHTSIDTIYLSNVKYDSIYIYKDRSSEYHRASPELVKGKPLNYLLRVCSPEHLLERKNHSETDTLFIKDVSIEYRYKLLRDTIKVIQCDSIPYEVTVIQNKEIKRPLTWYDQLCRISLWFMIGFLSFAIYRFFRR